MSNEQKILGMTRVQIGIVAGMAGALILLACIGGWLVFRSINPGLSALQQTPTTAPTVTPVVAVTPTLIPTITPTPIPYEQLIPAGWKQYTTPLVEIWAPGNFKLADKKTVDKMTAPGSAIPAIVLMEVTSKSSAYTMIIAVSYEPLVGDSLDSFLDGELISSSYQARVVDRSIVYVNSVEARRFLVEARVNNIDINELDYVFLDGSTVWYVQFGAEITEFYNNLPIFEQSIKTFRTMKY